MLIRAVGVAAPECISGVKKDAGTVYGSDPVSLYNAFRIAALLAKRKEGYWAHSNWKSFREKNSNRKILLMYSLEGDIAKFEQLLIREKPNLLFIGSMTLSFAGAIACAELAKKLLGDSVFVVLGGRHINETFYLSNDNMVKHHNGSPLKLMMEKKISKAFDLVVSGDGEYIIAKIGEVIGYLSEKNLPYSCFYKYKKELQTARGNWLIGWIEDDSIHTIFGKTFLNHNELPLPCSLFGIRELWDIFDGRLTAHVFSDIGRGCIYNCNFCSEAYRVTSSSYLIEKSYYSAIRLYKQFQDAYRVTYDDSKDLEKASAFVEDSVLLRGNDDALMKLYNLLSEDCLDILWGAQLTIDQIIMKKDIIKMLKTVGLNYLFIGLETFSTDEIGGMSKDFQKHKSWINKAGEVLDFLSSIGIKCGAAILFGLGESHASRMALFRQIEVWRQQYGTPDPISVNWAVQHPLCGNDGGAGYEYINWGTPTGPFSDVFHAFGEASLNYPIVGIQKPNLNEILEVSNQLFCYRGKLKKSANSC